MTSLTRKLFFVDGKPLWLNAEEEAELFGGTQGRPGGPGIASGYSEGKPGKSIAMSCHPKQADLMNKTVQEHGISGIEWDKKGKCIITSRRARARAMPIVGQMLGLGPVYDGDGGYGDG